jgi:hypothetical protein
MHLFKEKETALIHPGQVRSNSVTKNKVNLGLPSALSPVVGASRSEIQLPFALNLDHPQNNLPVFGSVPINGFAYLMKAALMSQPLVTKAVSKDLVWRATLLKAVGKVSIL